MLPHYQPLIKNMPCLFLIVVVTLLLSACQTNGQHTSYEDITSPSNTVNYAQYYLRLKQLNDSDLLTEITQQKSYQQAGSVEAQINLILLYSLPNAPIYNVYTAKSHLNKHFNEHPKYQFNNADLAFICLLKDQLNQQLFLFQQLISKEMSFEKMSQEHKDNQVKMDLIEQESAQLKEQILQLKKIEKTISGHE